MPGLSCSPCMPSAYAVTAGAAQAKITVAVNPENIFVSCSRSSCIFLQSELLFFCQPLAFIIIIFPVFVNI